MEQGGESPEREAVALAVGTPGRLAMRRLERSWVQASKQELHYASLLRLPEREGPDVREREGNKEDPSGDYACIAKNKPT
nr:leukocyte-specific transcript 1 protein isoform X2 [Ovis aries]